MLRVSRQLRQSVPRFVLEFARRDVAAIYVLFGGAPLYLASLSNNANSDGGIQHSWAAHRDRRSCSFVRSIRIGVFGARMEGKEGADSRAGATTARRGRNAPIDDSEAAYRATGLFACLGVLAVTGGWAGRRVRRSLVCRAVAEHGYVSLLGAMESGSAIPCVDAMADPKLGSR